MKSPITGKEMTLQTEKHVMVFRKEKFEYYHRSYVCEESGVNLTTTELDEFNLNQVYNQYRDRYNIPFTDEIIAFRQKYDLTATMMSKILGFGVNTYRNYEKGEVPSVANGYLLSSVIERFDAFERLVRRNNILSGTEKAKILKKIDKVIDQYDENKDEISYVDTLFEGRLAGIYSGYVKPSMQKMANMVLYFADTVQPSETKMNKLLFYSDFLNFKNHACSISGAEYIAHKYGPVPSRWWGIFDYVSEQDFIDTNVEHYGNGRIGTCFYRSNNRQFNSELFSDVELESLETVMNKFKGYTAKKIMEVSHEEKAWIDNEKTKGKIDYNYAFDLIHI